MKVTLKDIRGSRFPEAIGACYADLPRIANAVNECVQRLIVDPRQPDTGWYGTYVPMVFNVTRTDPYITVPKGVARLMNIDVCKTPVPLRNGFYEFLWATKGILPQTNCTSSINSACYPSINTQGVLRGAYPTNVDVPTTAGTTYYIRAYPTDALDDGKRILVQAYDPNDFKIYGMDGLMQMEGQYLTLASPFVTSTWTVGTKGIYGIQKDYTYGDVVLKAVDTVTGVETTLSRYEPGDTNPAYPRYYLDALPQYCCSSTTIQVNALAKLDYYPVAVESDWVLIGNIPALIAEAQSIYHDGIQEDAAFTLSMKKHAAAIMLLQGELDHMYGKVNPATNVALFGTAHPRYQSIGLVR